MNTKLSIRKEIELIKSGKISLSAATKEVRSMLELHVFNTAQRIMLFKCTKQIRTSLDAIPESYRAEVETLARKMFKNLR